MSVSDFLKKHKISAGVAGTTLVIATAYGSCQFTPTLPSAEEPAVEEAPAEEPAEEPSGEEAPEQEGGEEAEPEEKEAAPAE